MKNFLKIPIRGKSWFLRHFENSLLPNFFLSVVYGAQECLACGKVTFAVPVCAKCLEGLKNYVEFASAHRCSICSKQLLSEQKLCIECRNRKKANSFDALYVLHSYRIWKKNLVFAWKMEGNRRLSPLFADILYKALCELGLQNLTVVPVPPRPGKIKKEGWDQINDLAHFLSKKYNIQILHALKRNSTIQQKKLNRTERQNCGASYELLSKIAQKKIALPKKLVLLDDVVTTGATVENCTKLLKQAGTECVFVLALFKV